MPVRKQQLELDLEQQIGSKLGKEYDKAAYYYSAYLTSMQNARLDEAQAGIEIAGRNINNLICRWHHPYGRKEGGTKESLD